MRRKDPSPAAGEPPATLPRLDDDVEGQAARYLEEWRGRVNDLAADRLRELADLAESLSDWVEHTNRELDRLAAELSPGRVEAAAGSAAAVGAEGAETSAADAAHLVAMQMAVRGASREEVDQYLREVFEMEETAGILDRAFAG